MPFAPNRSTGWRISLIGLGIAVAVAACGPATAEPTPIIILPAPTIAPTPTPPPPQVVTVTLMQEPDDLNPLYTDQWTAAVLRDLWLVGLWNFDDAGRPVPQLALDIPSRQNGGISEDGLTITVKLNPETRWSDGQPVTSADFVFTYQMILSEQNTVRNRRPYPDVVAAVEAPDASTLVIRLQRPFAGWLTGLFRYVLPEHVLRPVFEAQGSLDDAEWNRAPTVGVGPFVFADWQPSTGLTFDRNPDFIRPPKVDTLIVQLVPDATAQSGALELGRSDLGPGLDPDSLPASALRPLAQPVQTGFTEGWFLNVNPRTAHPALLDPKVRKAIALGVDRQAIVQELWGGLMSVAATYWDTTPPYANPDLPPYPSDPAEAGRLLDEAGWVDNDSDGTRDRGRVELVLRYVTNQRPMRAEVQTRVAAQLSALGIGITPVTYSADVFWNSFGESGPQATGLYDIAEYASRGEFPEPDVRLWRCAEIPGSTNPNGRNWQGYCNADLDVLFDAQAATTDPQQRAEILRQIQAVLYDEVLWIGLWKDTDLWGVAQRLKHVRLSGITPFWNVAEWEVEP